MEGFGAIARRVYAAEICLHAVVHLNRPRAALLDTGGERDLRVGKQSSSDQDQIARRIVYAIRRNRSHRRAEVRLHSEPLQMGDQRARQLRIFPPQKMLARSEQGDREPVAPQRIHRLESDEAAANDHCAARLLFDQIALQPDSIVERI